jgi:hypothetical protein
MRSASKFLVAWAAVFVMAAVVSCTAAGDRSLDPAASAESALIGGTNMSPLNSGAIQIWPNGIPTITTDRTKRGCSAVIFAPHRVLTAAHCVDFYDSDHTEWGRLKAPYQPGSKIAFTNSPSVTPASRFFETTVVNTDVSPQYWTACANGCPGVVVLTEPYPPDLAMITITDPFPQSFGLAPTGIVSVAPFDIVTQTGYGCTTDMSTPDAVPLFKAATTIVIDPTTPPPGLPGFPTLTDPAAFSENFYVTRGRPASGVVSGCKGDSGGPLFKGGMSPYTELAGINSAVGPQDGFSIPYYTLMTRLDSPTAQDFLLSTLGKYQTPTALKDRGAGINDGSDPVAALFPLQTVGLETPGTPGCTGVILTTNSILTNAHCKVGPTTIAHFYVSDTSGGGNQIPYTTRAASQSVDVATQGVVCDPADSANYPASCFTGNGSTGAWHDADLAVLTLADPVPVGFNPVVLGPKEYVWENQPSPEPTAWQVATGGTMPIQDVSPMVWAPVTPATDATGIGQSRGWFNVNSFLAFWNDAGGPVFQTPQFLDGGESDGGAFQDMALLGLVSEIGNCPEGAVSCVHVNTVVSVTFPDNYDWLMGVIRAQVSSVATFGASE